MEVTMSAVSGFLWEESYKLGDEIIDSQHRQLFNLINSLLSSCINGDNEDVLKNALGFLVNYTIHHFNDEEALQKKCNFPEYENHKEMHENFKLTVYELVKRFEAKGSSFKLGSDLKSIVVKWLVNHILYEDKKIAAYL